MEEDGHLRNSQRRLAARTRHGSVPIQEDVGWRWRPRRGRVWPARRGVRREAPVDQLLCYSEAFLGTQYHVSPQQLGQGDPAAHVFRACQSRANCPSPLLGACDSSVGGQSHELSCLTTPRVGGCSESVVPNLSRKGPIHGQHGAVTGELTTRFRDPRPARVAPELLFDAHIEAISRPDFSAESISPPRISAIASVRSMVSPARSTASSSDDARSMWPAKFDF